MNKKYYSYNNKHSFIPPAEFHSKEGILGRDAFGKLVYVGDPIAIGEFHYGRVRFFSGGLTKDPRLTDYKHTGVAKSIYDHVTGSLYNVQLMTGDMGIIHYSRIKNLASGRTNWENYFADLGSIEEIKNLITQMMSEAKNRKKEERFWKNWNKGQSFYMWLHSIC